MFTGVFIAVATVLCWTVSVQFFEAASKRVGPTPVNIVRIGIAILLFGLLLLIRDGVPLPVDFPLRAWALLGFSGVVGFFIGDIFLFKALVEMGPRLTMLLHSLAAPTAAIIGWFFLDEHYTSLQWFGMAVTLSGVGMVIMEKKNKHPVRPGSSQRSATVAGVIFGLLAMAGQGCGMVLSKAGMQYDSGYLDAFAATQIRALAAFICFLVYFTMSRRWTNVFHVMKDGRALTYTTLGAAIGPFVGVSLALLSLHYISTGVASTIFALVPVFIIPFAIIIHHEHVSFRAIGGACIAVIGVYLLTS